MFIPFLLAGLAQTLAIADSTCTKSAPFFETFEDSAWQIGATIFNNPGQLDSCWSRSSTSGFYWTPFVGTASGAWTGPSAGAGGTGKYLYTAPSNSSTNSTSLCTPQFYVKPLDTLAMTFYTHIYDAFNEFQSFVVEADTGSGWFTLRTYTSGSQSSKSSPWDPRTIYLNAVRADTMQFQFTVNRQAGGFLKVGFDSFALVDTTCPAITPIYTYTGTGLNRFFSIANPKLNYSYRWFFGDGTSGTGAAVSHSYASPGSYTLLVETTSDCGRIDTVQAIFQICGPSNSAFTAVVSGDTVAFSSTGTGISGYYWDFGDGSFSTVQNPVHVYTSGGSFEVQLTTTNVCGESSTVLDTVSLCSELLPEFTAQIVATTAQGMQVQFNANLSQGSIETYRWNFGDNSTGTGVNPLKTYVIPGLNYLVTLTTEDSCGAEAQIQKSLNQVSLSESDGIKHWIYPNPAHDVLFLETTYPGRIDMLRLIDSQGKVIRSQAVQHVASAELDLRAIPSGFYRLEVCIEDQVWNLPVVVSP